MRRKPLAMGLVVATILCLAAVASPAPPARALVFNVTYGLSVVSAPAAFRAAFQDAINLYQTTYIDPITINIDVGWGEIDGNPLSPGNLGQSRTNQPGNFTYSQVRSALISDAKSAADSQAISTLGATDPTGGRAFRMSDAEAKALGLRVENAPGIDGWVGFSSTASYTFDPNNRAVAGEFDFISVAEHEIAEIMGRYGMTQNGCGATLCDSPIDLFRYTSPGNIDLNPENGSYFSIDSGNTNINTFNGTGGGDLSDWLGLTPDVFNHSLSRGNDPCSTTSANVKAVIGFYGVYDMVAQWEHDQITRPRSISVTEKLLGCSPMISRRAFFEASPLSYATVDKNNTRFLLIYSREDDIVEPATQSEKFLTGLKQAGFFARRIVVPGAGHFWSVTRSRSPAASALTPAPACYGSLRDNSRTRW